MAIQPEEPILKPLSQTPIDKSNSSYAKQKLTLLAPLSFKKEILPVRTVIFSHIPKTAGTMTDCLARAKSKLDTTFKQARIPVPRIPKRSPILITEGWQGSFDAALDNLKDNPDYYAEFNFISGHFPFGLHTNMTNASEIRYVTLIRDPVEREISSTNFDFQRGYVGKEDLEKYLLTALDNPQTRMLAGPIHLSGLCTESTLNQAKRNIESHFLLAGITEDTYAFMQILISIQGWGAFAVCEVQITGEKPIQATPELQSKLQKKHIYDVALYHWAKERWLKFKQEIIIEEPKTPPKLPPTIPCILPDSLTTKEPALWSEKEIVEHNRALEDSKKLEELVAIQQNHGIPSSLPAKPGSALLPRYSALKDGSNLSNPSAKPTQFEPSTKDPRKAPSRCTIL